MGATASCPRRSDRGRTAAPTRRRGARRAGSGVLRPARRGHRDLLIAWLDDFAADTGEVSEPSGSMVDRFLDEQSAWLWIDNRDAPGSMARATPVAGGVARVGPVYTPPERRGRGYATACVEHLSRRIEDGDHTAILYTQLSNPSSNAIYRRIGYEPMLEVLHYRFGPPPLSA